VARIVVAACAKGLTSCASLSDASAIGVVLGGPTTAEDAERQTRDTSEIAPLFPGQPTPQSECMTPMNATVVPICRP